MPISYPSNSQPSFVLSACWLSNAALAKLCQGLDMLWKDQVGNVVIYSWAEWLQTTCLSYLGITSELELDFGHNNKACDDRVVSYRTAPDRLIQFLIRYNEDKKSEIFLNSIHTCYICFSDVLGMGT
jgi:E3 ubiquitin-protein ligase RNF14